MGQHGDGRSFLVGDRFGDDEAVVCGYCLRCVERRAAEHQHILSRGEHGERKQRAEEKQETFFHGEPPCQAHSSGVAGLGVAVSSGVGVAVGTGVGVAVGTGVGVAVASTTGNA